MPIDNRQALLPKRASTCPDLGILGADAVDMCAADGTCSSPCPISIDTGAVMKQLRKQEAGPKL